MRLVAWLPSALMKRCWINATSARCLSSVAGVSKSCLSTDRQDGSMVIGSDDVWQILLERDNKIYANYFESPVDTEQFFENLFNFEWEPTTSPTPSEQ